MWIPPQGFRHAATLLLTNRARAIPIDAPADAVRTALEHLARELVALAKDMRMREEVAGWLTAEFNMLVDRFPASLDRTATKGAAALTFARLADPESDQRTCDLFLIYVPEDRLPIAAPLAIELKKRRMSVAFAGYEVATASELAQAVERGLMLHQCGVVLRTTAFDRRGWKFPETHGRLRVIGEGDLQVAVADLIEWIGIIRVSGN